MHPVGLPAASVVRILQLPSWRVHCEAHNDPFRIWNNSVRMPNTSSIWVVTDGRAGNERQALALAHALSDATPRVWRINARAPWRWLSPRRMPGSTNAFGDEFRRALRNPPNIVVGCGRQAALATRLLRDAGARSVQILDPRIDPRHWDAVVVPEHDSLRGDNVITTQGSLHAVDADWLERARAQQPLLGELASPRTLLLVGGPIANAPLDAAWWRTTAEQLRVLHQHESGSLSICGSQRTPEWLVRAARDDLRDIPGTRWFNADDGENLYAGLLAWADRIIVSPDSVNMLSEVTATTADVRIASPELARGRHAAFLQQIIARGRATAMDDSISDIPAIPLAELQRVALEVRALIA